MTYRTYAHTFPCGDATEAAGADRAKSHEIIADDMADLERLVDDLEAVADWKEEIAAKIRRAQLRFDLVGLDQGEVEGLTAEVRNFNRLCLALGQSLRRAA
jgi:hypothetical protein